MLWGATLRSPHAHARVAGLDVAPALKVSPACPRSLTIDDVPGARRFGLEHADQPVLADGVTRFWGEPVAIVAADDPEDARRGVAAVDVALRTARTSGRRRGGGVPGRGVPPASTSARGDPAVTGAVVVEGTYEVGMQDQAPLGPESGLAVPDGQGGVDLYVATQWTHTDHAQIVACLGVAEDQVRVHHAGIGGAFGAREDVSLQIHLCLLALATGRPVKMVYDRKESFVGHVHRHPARMWYRHEATPDGDLVRVGARMVFDGGAYASSSTAVVANASYFAVGPYRCGNVFVESHVTRTNNPPCGAMRGFGAVQACFGHEAQMDRLAEALGMDPLELRLRNALAPGDPMPTTGQVIQGSLPTTRVIEELRRDAVAAGSRPDPCAPPARWDRAHQRPW